MRLALAQINPTVGDLRGNASIIGRRIEEARAAGADLVVFPELAACAYPPRDLLTQEGFVERVEREIEAIGARTRGITAIVGLVRRREDGRIGNSLRVFRDGRRVADYDKRLLPTYDVFDERRYFEPGDRPVVVDVAGVRVGLAVCEDAWGAADVGMAGRYGNVDPIADLAAAGAQLIALPSASPFVVGKGKRQRALLAAHAKRHGVHVAVVNQVGGNDELVFDGHGAVVDPAGEVVAAAPVFREHLLVCDPESARGGARDALVETGDERMVLEALALGVRDYVRKTGHERALIGLSGGIDSSLTAAVAAIALGGRRVTGVLMPGPYSSAHSVTDARAVADALGIETVTVPIAGPMEGFVAALGPAFEAMNLPRIGGGNVTEQNLQARSRGMILMAISNATGALVLATGNKSEFATGYCTLYGDMNGALAVLSDLVKRRVYAVARLVNELHGEFGFSRAPIPERVLRKAPSAELAPDQTDQDTLPPYEVLDEIVERYVERGESAERIAAETGFDGDVVRKSVRMIDVAEFKRRQMATGIKVTARAFGVGWRQPIARGW